jgi:hypothetical protein
MGLDIYVRWDKMSKNEKTLQYTGMKSSPSNGYIRENWRSLEWVNKKAKELNAPNPYSFFPEWKGYNGEETAVDSSEKIQKLIEFRDKTLRCYLSDKWENNKSQQVEINREKRSALPEKEQNEFWENFWSELNAFEQRILDVIGLINFVQCNIGKAGLKIVFG